MRPRIPNDEIRALLAQAQNPLMVEVGANDGRDTQVFVRLFGTLPGFRLHCFEPDPRGAAKIRSKGLHRLSKVRFFEQAVSDREGRATLLLSEGVHPTYPGYGNWDKASSLRAPTESFHESWPWLSMAQTADVEAVTLDGWAAREGVEKIDFLWVDVEGATDQLVRGARNILRKTRYFYAEYATVERYRGEPLLRDLVDMLADDFTVAEVFQDDVLFRGKHP